MKTKRTIQSTALLLFVLCLSTPIFSQKDTIKNTPSDILDSKKNLKPVDLFKPNTVAKKNTIKFTPQENLSKVKLNDKKYYELYNKPKRKMDFKKHANNVDSDVLVIKHFNGKKITNAQNKIKSDYSLGSFYTNSKSVRIEVRDFGLEDGDRIKIYLNGEVIEKSIELKNMFYFIVIPLVKNYNTISIKALNQGYAGPNTAELEIYDDKGNIMTSHIWNINTGEVVTVGLVKK
ncbi:MAG: hypothetical protein L3J45_06045 [Flavobacteriaceae bacterium]|nr:hypothetical protein [Flavobacteriaceae bacterium]